MAKNIAASGIAETSIHTSTVPTYGPRHPDASDKVIWLLSIPTVADVVSRPEPLDALTTIHEHARARLDDSLRRPRQQIHHHYFAEYSSLPRAHRYGGILHLRRQTQRLTVLGKSIYLDLCANHHSIDQLQFDLEGLDATWTWLLAGGELRNNPANLGANKLFALIRSVVLIEPSLPAPSGMARTLGRLIRPLTYGRMSEDPQRTKLLDKLGGRLFVVFFGCIHVTKKMSSPSWTALLDDVSKSSIDRILDSLINSAVTLHQELDSSGQLLTSGISEADTGASRDREEGSSTKQV